MYPNVFNIKHKPLSKHAIEKVKPNDVSKSIHQPPLVKEWYNSIYAFNKNILKLTPVLDKNLHNILTSYFNMYNVKLNEKIKPKELRIKEKELLEGRLLISKLNLKHTGDKVNITVYTYNIRKKCNTNRIVNSSTFMSSALDFKNIEQIFFSFIKNSKIRAAELELKLKEHTSIFLREVASYLKEKKHVFLVKQTNKFYITNYVKKQMYKEIVSVRDRQSIYLEESKNKKQYLLPLIALVERFYNKKVTFNIINLKYFYNSSNIFSKAIMIKLNNRKNKAKTVLIDSLNTFESFPLNKYTMYNDMYNTEKFKQNFSVEDLISNTTKLYTTNDATRGFLDKDILDQSLLNAQSKNYIMGSNTTKTSLNQVIKSLKNKFIQGMRIEVAGRLSNRNTADRSMFTLRYKGSIKNSDSSHKKLPVVLLRGYAKPNLMYNQSKSTSDVGAFGVKTWVSST